MLYAAATGQISGNAPSSLYTLDPGSGATTLVGPIGFSGVTGLAFAADGTLYGSWNDREVSGDYFLVTIDPATGVTTPIGPTVRGLDAIAFIPCSCSIQYDVYLGKSDPPTNLVWPATGPLPISRPLALRVRMALPTN